MPILGIDHVQVAIPSGGEDEARRFYGALLGLEEVPKPPALAVRGGAWFQCGAQQIHVGVEQDFRPARKAHPAFRLADADALARLRAHLVSNGVSTRDDPDGVAGQVRFFVDDPFGNRIELLAPA